MKHQNQPWAGGGCCFIYDEAPFTDSENFLGPWASSLRVHPPCPAPSPPLSPPRQRRRWSHPSLDLLKPPVDGQSLQGGAGSAGGGETGMLSTQASEALSTEDL